MIIWIEKNLIVIKTSPPIQIDHLIVIYTTNANYARNNIYHEIKLRLKYTLNLSNTLQLFYTFILMHKTRIWKKIHSRAIIEESNE